MQIRIARTEDHSVPQKGSLTAGSVAPRRRMMVGNITREEPMLVHRSVEGWGLRDRTGHFPRFEHCFIGLFTASSMIVAGEGEAMEARRNDSPSGWSRRKHC